MGRAAEVHVRHTDQHALWRCRSAVNLLGRGNSGTALLLTVDHNLSQLRTLSEHMIST